MSAASLEQQLVDTYNEIDTLLRDVVNYDKHLDHSALLREAALTNPVVARNLNTLRTVARLRNTIIHNPFGSEVSPLITPHEEIVKRYKDILHGLKNPPAALSIAIRETMIFTTTMEDNLNKVLKKMDKNIFTHVPVMEGKRMIGILSENSLLSYVADMEDVIIDKETKVGELEKYLPLDSHRGENFEFLPKDASLEAVFKLFNEAIKERIRIGMVFITEHGKSTERPLGILTAWDLANFEPEALV